MASASLDRAVSAHSVGRVRWSIIFMIFLATTINYIDRQTISVAAPVITKEFQLSAQQYAWILSAFLLAYAIMQFVAGRVIDVVGTKRGFSISLIWWSIATMLHAFGAGFVSFAAFRFLLGVGEAGNYPAALKAISEWFPKSERATAVGILNAGPGLGAILAPPLVAWLILSVGWRWAFGLTGVIGLLWLIAWQRWYFTPESHPRLTREEADLILADRVAHADRIEPTSWLHFFRYREVWGVMLARFVSDGAFYFFVFWLPKYLSDVRGFGIAQIGMFAWIPFLAADLGSLFGGGAGSRLIKRGLTVNASRKAMMWFGAILVPVSYSALFVDSPYTALALIAVAMFAIQVKSASLFTLPADLVSSRHVATVWGLSGAAGSLGGMLFTPLVGWLVDNMSYQPVFMIVSMMHIVSALIVMLMIPRIEPLDSASAARI